MRQTLHDRLAREPCAVEEEQQPDRNRRGLAEARRHLAASREYRSKRHHRSDREQVGIDIQPLEHGADRHGGSSLPRYTWTTACRL
jgi:hypothetical protein